MELNLDPRCQAALDLAKRAVPDGEELDIGLMMAALYHEAELREDFPSLASALPEPKIHRDVTPEKVRVAESLQPILGAAPRNEPLTPQSFFEILSSSEPGLEYLRSHGASAEPAANSATAEPESNSPSWRDSSDRKDAVEALSSFGRMLTSGEPPHRGTVEMGDTIQSLVRTLSKMRRRNAILIGYPGTGKSAVIYELARRLVQGDPSIPATLRDHDIFELSPSFLRSGASMVGQYDERVKALLAILCAHKKIILFVDEIHSLFQSSVHERGPFSDANESFKGVLGRGEIICLGCTTPSEYRHYIEPDQALTRRFSVIRLDPPSPEATLRILAARKPKMEEYYAPLRIPDAILEKTVELTEDYLLTRFQPDKSIQLLDEACAHCATSDPSQSEMSENALWRALEDMVGHSVAREENLAEEEVFEKLRSKIVGQDGALRGIARAFVSGLGGWVEHSGPRGIFFFCGPTGIGKTETALQLAEILGGGREALIEVNCNILQGSGNDSNPAINVLLGPPPGYVGFVRGGGGVLSEIRDRPESIVLFDEIEKADPGVGKLLLQILDDGRVEDSEGNPLDFRRSFIIFTSNAGSVYDPRGIGFERTGAAPVEAPRADLDQMKDELRALGFGEEFLGRIGHFFLFEGLQPNAIRSIIQTQLERLRNTAELKGYDLAWEPETIGYLTDAWQPRFGVRHLLTILRHRIVEQLSVAEAQGELKGINDIFLDVLEPEEVVRASLPRGAATHFGNGATLTIQLS